MARCATLRSVFPLSGKGLWLQRVAACENGDLDAILARAQAAGLRHVIVKIADGADPANVEAHGRDLARDLTARLSAAGLAVWGWQSLYGDRPAFKGPWVEAYHLREAEAARARVRGLQAAGLRGLVLETRSAYEYLAGRARKAAEFTDFLRGALPDLPLALSSWKSPAAHPGFPWAEFRRACALDLPQVFWSGRHGEAVRHLEAAARHFSRLTPLRPLVPVGPAFFEANWRPAPGDLTEFVQHAHALGLPAVNLWLWDQLGLRGDEPHNPLRLDFRAQWRAFADAAWPVAPAPVEPSAAVAPITPIAANVEEFDFAASVGEEIPAGPPALVEVEPPAAARTIEEFDLAIAVNEDEAPAPADEPEPAAEQAWPGPVEPGPLAVGLDQPGAPVEPPASAAPEAGRVAARTERAGPPPGRQVFLTPAEDTALQPELARFFKSLRVGRLDDALRLYAPTFSHVTSARVAHEPAEVKALYQAAWARWQPASLAVRAARGAGLAWRVTWAIHDTAGRWAEFVDEFHFNRAGEIVYHQTRLAP